MLTKIFHDNEKLDGVLLLSEDDEGRQELLCFEDVIECFKKAMERWVQRKETDHMSRQLWIWALGEEAEEGP